MSIENNPRTFCFITTLKHNPGDDFVRSGIEYLLEQAYGDFRSVYIHKHLPGTGHPLVEKLYLISRKVQSRIWTKAIDRILTACDFPFLKHHIDEADVLVQCGAPIFWITSSGSCIDNEWYHSLIRSRWNKRKDKGLFLNIGGGTCQKYGSDGSEYDSRPDVIAHIRELYKDADLTTVRDHLSSEILRKTGYDVSCLPCPSIFARLNEKIEPSEPEYVALNFMPRGGHSFFDEGIDGDQWTKVFVEFANNLSKQTSCRLICHNKEEFLAAQELLPSIQILYSPDYRELLGYYSKAKWGIFNRVHAGFALASFGRPSLIVGSDSRAEMGSIIGLEHAYVGDTTIDALNSAASRLESGAESYSERFNSLRDGAIDAYLKSLSEVLSP